MYSIFALRGPLGHFQIQNINYIINLNNFLIAPIDLRVSLDQQNQKTCFEKKFLFSINFYEFNVL